MITRKGNAMSVDAAVTADRPPRGRRIVGVAGLGAALALPLAAVSGVPAQAQTTSGGCRLVVHQPWHNGFYPTGAKKIRYDLSLFCTTIRAVKTVKVEQHFMEEDDFPDNDDFQGGRVYTRNFIFDGSYPLEIEKPLLDSEGGKEEIYQKARFQVVTNGVTSAWTPWERTSYLSIPN